MVIAVLSLLLSIIMPSTKALREAARRRHAATGATALVQAVLRYQVEYGFWPGQLEYLDENHVKINSNTPDYYAFLPPIYSAPDDFKLDIHQENSPDTSLNILRISGNEVFQALNPLGKLSGNTYQANPLNPRGIEFLPLINQENFDLVNYNDPWGQPYVLFMGLNPHTQFTYQVVDTAGHKLLQHSVSNQIAFAFSRGAPGINVTNIIYSAGVTPWER